MDTSATSAAVNQSAAPDEVFLRLPAVMARVGLSKTTIYQLILSGRFPSMVKLGPRTSAWRASDIARWMARQG